MFYHITYFLCNFKKNFLSFKTFDQVLTKDIQFPLPSSQGWLRKSHMKVLIELNLLKLCVIMLLDDPASDKFQVTVCRLYFALLHFVLHVTVELNAKHCHRN